MKKLTLCLLGFMTLAGSSALALAADKTVRVRFAAGASSIQINDTIKGYDTINYLVGASAGQQLAIKFHASNGGNFFNVFAPGMQPGKAEALFRGDLEGNQFGSTLSVGGDYLVQVYLFRNVARRNEHSNFKLNIAITGSGNAGGAMP